MGKQKIKGMEWEKEKKSKKGEMEWMQKERYIKGREN